tara:strand:+ start:634 stop:930 length:297 start_codon:yes stop_codon:yes gene_type:complete
MTHNTEIQTSLAMLVSVFGNPTHADSEANRYEWHLEFADGTRAILSNASTGGSSARVQAWELSSDSETAIAQVTEKLQEGENYYDGALHPELFIDRNN